MSLVYQCEYPPYIIKLYVLENLFLWCGLCVFSIDSFNYCVSVCMYTDTCMWIIKCDIDVINAVNWQGLGAIYAVVSLSKPILVTSYFVMTDSMKLVLGANYSSTAQLCVHLLSSIDLCVCSWSCARLLWWMVATFKIVCINFLGWMRKEGMVRLSRWVHVAQWVLFNMASCVQVYVCLSQNFDSSSQYADHVIILHVVTAFVKLRQT